MIYQNSQLSHLSTVGNTLLTWGTMFNLNKLMTKFPILTKETQVQFLEVVHFSTIEKNLS